MEQNGGPDSLRAILSRLPPETPVLIPGELLAVWFPPWGNGETDPDHCIEDATQVGAAFGCSFSFDTYMQQWCFKKSAVRN
jgi:hypothetical protein